MTWYLCIYGSDEVNSVRPTLESNGGVQVAIKMFISCSSEDNRFVDRIELLLARKFRNKIEPVISAQQKKIGVSIPQKIIGNIEECKWFLALLTRNSISNPTVMHELGYANALFKARSITRIIPIVERIRDDSGKYVPIDAGVFFDRNIESANGMNVSTK